MDCRGEPSSEDKPEMNEQLRPGSFGPTYFRTTIDAGSAGPRSESAHMAVLVPVIKAGARFGGAAILALVLAAPMTLPTTAASPRFQFGHRGGNGNDGPSFNMDSDPCALQSGGRHRGQACPPDRFQPPRGEHGPREPGSNAFGLQFNSDGD
jgi:hypothetical protein